MRITVPLAATTDHERMINTEKERIRIMNLSLVDKITKEQIRDDIPDFKPGDSVKVFVRIREGEKSRIQMFEGVCVGRNNGGIGETFTVRKISGGVGVQRTFPVNSPIIDHVEVTRRGKVRRAKLTYLKGRSAKNSRIKEDRRAK
jgi:large subunit ribosomal protein L19